VSDFERQYRTLTDDQLSAIKRADLVPEAQAAYEAEIKRRAAPEFREEQRLQQIEEAARWKSVVQVTARRQYNFPPFCACCFAPIEGKSELLITSQDRVGLLMFANGRSSIRIPYCQACKRHVGPVSKSGAGCLYTLWFIGCAIGLGFVFDRQRGILPQTSGKAWALMLLLVGIVAPFIFWLVWERPRRYARAQRKMGATCASLKPAVWFGLHGLVFENSQYAEAFVRANPNTAKLRS